ncbi:pyroglutamyl-peptidase I [Botrimarina sp.]|uniref:pyroglutamyl-peptidase I n=1 Tax=Botrimarina sp. TaxID=2795802 RepID=UPI0032EB3BC7
MARLLLTAFRPFDGRDENASWLALQSLTRDLSGFASAGELGVTTRLYPVDYDELKPRLSSDLADGYDVVLHVGQAAGAAAIRLEQFALNARRDRGDRSDAARPLEPDGPAAYRSGLPLGDWTRRLRDAGAPAELSLHAGDYLCNAAMYWSHHLTATSGQRPLIGFVHLPLDVSQAAAEARETPSLPTEISALALRLLVAWSAEACAAACRVAEGAAAPHSSEATA